MDNLLRTLLIHLGCGHSLRETVVRARQANLADLSDVALLKRLRKSKDWLYALCVRLFQEHGIAVATGDGFQIRAFDATTVKEPDRKPALWRIHYSVCLPSLACELTRTESANRWRFPIRAIGPSRPRPGRAQSASFCTPLRGRQGRGGGRR